EEDGEHDHRQQRLRNGPADAENRLDVTNEEVSPDEVVEEIPLRGELVEVRPRRASLRVDRRHRAIVDRVVSHGRFPAVAKRLEPAHPRRTGSAGLPATTAPAATSVVTTLWAPTIAPSPMVTPFRTIAPNPSQTRAPITTGAWSIPVRSPPTCSAFQSASR